MNNSRTWEPIGSKALIIDHFVAFKDLWKSIQPYGGPGQEMVKAMKEIEQNGKKISQTK